MSEQIAKICSLICVILKSGYLLFEACIVDEQAQKDRIDPMRYGDLRQWDFKLS